MLNVVIGASASGKSEYAEKLAAMCYRKASEHGKNGGLFYVAAMKPYGSEAEKRIERHRKLRTGKGFETLEAYTHLENLNAHKGDVLLIECMSNLLANEIYEPDGGLRDISDEKTDKLHSVIVTPIVNLTKAAEDVIVVTNDVFSDGRHFAGEYIETEKYCRLLGDLNIMLAKYADTVTEVVCGIPQIIRKV